MEKLPDHVIADRIEEAVSASRPKKLLAFLDERCFLFKDRGANEVVRIRGFTLSRFKDAGLPKEGVPYVLEELENGRHPYLIAGAARALRGQKTPLVQAVPYLLNAMNNLSHGDDRISFDSLQLSHPSVNYTTALEEILHTLQWYGAYARSYAGALKEMLNSPRINLGADNRALVLETLSVIEKDSREVPRHCCEKEEVAFSRTVGRHSLRETVVREVRMEDHTGTSFSYLDYFSGKPSVIVFFYTRCDNPNKCSLTVTRLAHLQQLLREKGLGDQVNLATFTYDPLYDEPFRLRNYNESRQVVLGENCRSFRVIRGFEALQAYLHLGVNYIGSMVNRHKIELYLLDKDGSVYGSYTRTQWDQQKVFGKVKALVDNKRKIGRTVRNVTHNFLSVLLFLGIAFFPKCPLCLVAYMSVLGIGSLDALAFSPWLVPLLVTGLGVNLWVLWRGCRQRNEFLPFYLGLAGAVVIAISSLWLHWKTGSIIGLSLVLASAMLNSLPLNVYNRMQRSWFRWATSKLR
ncbi:MAG TPA: SCO family protein [Puia sp.]|nr:SCO family protein [Puia sp.]